MSGHPDSSCRILAHAGTDRTYLSPRPSPPMGAVSEPVTITSTPTAEILSLRPPMALGGCRWPNRAEHQATQFYFKEQCHRNDGSKIPVLNRRCHSGEQARQ